MKPIMLSLALVAGLLSSQTIYAANIKTLIEREARKQGVDPKLAVAVAIVESALNQAKIGSQGEIGIFQLHPRLFDPAIVREVNQNIKEGVRHLKYWKRVCPVQEQTAWVTCYNQGFRNPRHPTLLPYYKKVMSVYEKR